MGKGFFTNRFSRSVQNKIDLMRRRQKKEGGADLPSETPVEEQLTPEELEYLKRLQEGLMGNGGSSSPDEPGSAPRLSGDNGTERKREQEAEEEEEDRRNDPFAHAEREVELLIREAETRHRSRAPKAAPPPPPPPPPADETDEGPPPSSFQAIEEPPEPPAPRVRRERVAAPTEVEPILEPLAEEPEPEPEPTPTERRADAEDDTYEHLGKLPFPPGTIVRLGNEVGIIKEEVPNREYDLVYLLCADGRIEPRGVTLYSYDLERLGRLPKEELGRVAKRQYWDRDRLIYHLDDISFARGIPMIMPKGAAEVAPAQPARSEPYDDGHSLQRGRLLSIVYGEKSWDAVYWGEDSEGAIVAHAFAPDEWDVMRLDLNRFGASLKRGRLISERELKAIEEQVVQKIERESKD